MHEMTVVLNIVDFVDDFAEKEAIDEVASVHVQIGGLTGVVAHFVEECWEAAIDHSKHLKNSQVIIEDIPGIGKCLDCGKKYIVPVCKGVCPHCKSHNWKPISGNDVQIKEILAAK